MDKKLVRKRFRDAVFSRDGHQCRFCDVRENLDAHHIVDRHEMPNGGYVAENGISLCARHHEMAELFHQTEGRESHPGMSPYDLYALISSSYDAAWEASERL